MSLDKITFFKKEKAKKLKMVVAAGALLLGTVIFTCCRGGDDVKVSSDELTGSSSDGSETYTSSEEVSADQEESGVIYIDVCGAVQDPNVVCIPEGSRVFEAIDAAGGTTVEAELKYMNLAAVCEDGQKIYVPTTEEVQADLSGKSILPEGYSSGMSVSSSITGYENEGDGKVNINTAESDELQSLTGIGPSMAQRIIDYRTGNGGFSAVEDLKNVSGIGDKTFEKLKEHVCV